MLSWPAKDPRAILDYDIDWAAEGYLQTGETIVTSTWSIVEGDGQLTILNSPAPSIASNSAGTALSLTKLWLSGGTDGQAYELLNEIVTSDGRTDDRHVKIRVRLK